MRYLALSFLVFFSSLQAQTLRIGLAEDPDVLDPSLARGAFPASPVVDVLRGDVTGHALLAMLASKKSIAAP